MTAQLAPVTHLILVRHAQSLHNRDGRTGAGPDTGLTELGWRQAQAVAAWLAVRQRPAIVATSALMRARQTAEVIAARLDVPMIVHDGLEEAEFYFWDELPARWETPMASWSHDWQPNSENAPLYSSLRARLRDSLDRLLAEHPGDTVVAVTHGGAIGTILRGLFGGHHMAVHTENTGATQISWDAGHWRLDYHNCTSHLEALTTIRPAPQSASVGSAAGLPGTVANGGPSEDLQKHFKRVAAALTPERAGITTKDLQELVRLAAPRGDERLLDVGTGDGAVAISFASHAASVVGVDVSPAMLERAEASRTAANATNVHFRLGDISVLPIADGSFEIIVCHNLFQYVPDLPALLRRLRLLLTPGGKLLADVLLASDDPVRRATHNAIEIRRDPAISEVRSPGELERDLAASGFRLAKLERYAVVQELDSWLSQAAADEATRDAVHSMIEAGLEADSAGLAARRGRDGQIVFTESRARLVATPHELPA